MGGLLEFVTRSVQRFRVAIFTAWRSLLRRLLWTGDDWTAAAAADPDRSLFARALPRKVSITETYGFHQVLSVNPMQQPAMEVPSGRIDITVPYDGDRYFTRQAAADVSAHLARRDDDPATLTDLNARVGHLVLINTRDALTTDGAPLVDLHGAIPLHVPVRTPRLRHVDLLSDRCEATRRIEYVPVPSGNQPYPIKVWFELYDPDDQEFTDDDVPRIGRRRSSDEPARIVRQPAFSSELWLMVTIGVVWPKRRRKRPDVRIKRVALEWPTITSLEKRSLQFWFPGQPIEMLYDPVSRSLEWVDVPFADDATEPDAKGPAEPDSRAARKPKKGKSRGTAKDDDQSADSDRPAAEHPERNEADDAADEVDRDDLGGDEEYPNDERDDEGDDEDLDDGDEGSEGNDDDGELWRLTSAPLTVRIQQPGQLRNAEMLSGEVEAEVERELLSGIQARLFDACGRRMPPDVLKVRTRLRLRFDAYLEDEFERRETSATHTMHFDEVIPDTARIDDIVSALRDRGFDIDDVSQPAEGNAGNPEWVIRASRAEGPNEVKLILVVRGRRYTTRRRAETPGWHRYTSKFDSGELRIAVYGAVPRTSRELTEEVNRLRDSLSVRFKHVQAQR